MTQGALRVDVYEAHRDPAEKLTDLLPGFRSSEVSVLSIHFKKETSPRETKRLWVTPTSVSFRSLVLTLNQTNISES